MSDPAPIFFFVAGIPKAQPRPRAFARKFGDTYSARVYDAKTAEGWKGLVALAARPYVPSVPLAGPLRVDAHFLFPRPASLMRKRDPDGEFPHDRKPDRDNLDKALLDCLKTIRIFVDDAQVCDGRVRKFWVAKDGSPGVRIWIGAALPATEAAEGGLFR